MPFNPVNIGTPGKIRTCDPLIRSQILYPAELRVPATKILDSEPVICKLVLGRPKPVISAASARV